MSADSILVVDDEANIVDLVRMYLEREGFRVEAASDGQQAIDAVERQRPDLMILDLMLPVINGLDVCRRVRTGRAAPDLPIIMLTARDDDIDKIVGLELGADDYVTKPFNPRELVARIKAILRRVDAFPPVNAPLRVGDLTIDPARYEVTVANKPVRLRRREFDLLLALAEHEGIVLSREQLLSSVWGYSYYGETRTVDVHIAQLRKKLSGASVRIDTVVGIGYKLVAD